MACQLCRLQFGVLVMKVQVHPWAVWSIPENDKRLYIVLSLHMELNKKDSLTKKLKAVENAMKRREDPKEAQRYWKKERRNINSAWPERKQRRQFSQKLTTPVKRRVKNLEQKLRRKYMKFSEEKSSKKGIFISSRTSK